MTPHRVRVEGGVVRFEDRAQFERSCKKLPDGEYLVILDLPDVIRTHLQNRYYWGGVIGPLASFLGYLPLELHALLKVKFPPKYGDSTSTESTKDFSERIENIRSWALERHEFVILSPEEWREREMQKRRLKIGDGVFGAALP